MQWPPRKRKRRRNNPVGSRGADLVGLAYHETQPGSSEAEPPASEPEGRGFKSHPGCAATVTVKTQPAHGSKINDTKARKDDMDREEHLDWAKQRALEYVDANDLIGGFTSMASDLNKHPDLVGHAGIQLGMMQVAGGQLDSQTKMRYFILDFN